MFSYIIIITKPSRSFNDNHGTLEKSVILQRKLKQQMLQSLPYEKPYGAVHKIRTLLGIDRI